jgi:hypothetical protein
MSRPFQQARNVELSLLYYLEQSIPADWSGVTVLKTFAQVYSKEKALPIVCARLADTQTERREIGADTLENRYLLIIDIFATDDGMRLDFSYYIKDLLKSGWIHYDHTSASGTLSRTENGRDWVTEWITDARVDLGESADQKDRYRHTLSMRVRCSPVT